MEFCTISGGRFKLDGGSMFGIIPKPLWEKIAPADERNRIHNDTNCLLVRMGDKLLLVDTGYGTKMSEKERDIYAMTGSTILESLALIGVRATDIDIVVLSHLHFDHAGGATVTDLEGHLYPAFPRARYFVQRGEWEDALSGYVTMTTTYREENYLPLKEHGMLTLLDGDGEICPGLRVRITGGHTRHHQMVVFESDRETVVYAGDILPMTTHMRAPYNMGYDLFPYDTMTQKIKLLEQASEKGWTVVYDHDPNLTAGRIVAEGKDRYRVEKREWE